MQDIVVNILKYRNQNLNNIQTERCKRLCKRRFSL